MNLSCLPVVQFWSHEEADGLGLWVSLADISANAEMLQNSFVFAGLEEQPFLNTLCQGEQKNAACDAAPWLGPLEQ